MFFRNAKAKVWTFDDRMASLKQAGFKTSQVSGGSRVTRGGYGAMVEDKGNGLVALGKSGLLVGDEIAILMNHGYQMFFATPSGKELPALAPHLKALHDFDEDLREAVGITNLYNLALGTTSEAHMYDRVVDRDRAPHPRPWDK